MRGFKQHLWWDYLSALIWIYSVLIWALRRRNYNPSEKHMKHRWMIIVTIFSIQGAVNLRAVNCINPRSTANIVYGILLQAHIWSCPLFRQQTINPLMRDFKRRLQVTVVGQYAACGLAVCNPDVTSRVYNLGESGWVPVGERGAIWPTYPDSEEVWRCSALWCPPSLWPR